MNWLPFLFEEFPKKVLILTVDQKTTRTISGMFNIVL